MSTNWGKRTSAPLVVLFSFCFLGFFTRSVRIRDDRLTFVWRREASRYLWKTDQLNKLTSCTEEMDKIKARAKSLLVVVSTPPTENYGSFTTKVREYNAREPFNFTTPQLFQKYEKVYHGPAD